MNNISRKYLRRELTEYENRTAMNDEERRALHDWVRSGHSVYEAPSSHYHCDSGFPGQDFLDVYRGDKEIDMILEGKTDVEKEQWVKETFGCEESSEKAEPTMDQLKKETTALKRELSHLWDFVIQSGTWSAAEEYIRKYGNDPIPFE